MSVSTSSLKILQFYFLSVTYLEVIENETHYATELNIGNAQATLLEVLRLLKSTDLHPHATLKRRTNMSVKMPSHFQVSFSSAFEEVPNF